MRTKFKLIGLVVVLCIINAITVLGAEINKKIYYNNYDMGITAIKQNNAYYIPLKDVVEQVHFSVIYDESTQTTKVYDNVDTVTVNSKGELTSDGKIVDTKCVPIVKNGKTYVPLTFFSKGLRFGVSETNDKIKMYGKNMYKLVVGDEDFDGNHIEYVEIHSKKDMSEDLPRVSVGYAPKKQSDARLSVYRTKNENDVIEYYEYNGENVYPTIITLYNRGYISMETFSHESPKSYVSFIMAPETITPTQEDFNYYKKPLEDRVAAEGDMIAFTEIVQMDQKNRIEIWDDSKYAEDKVNKRTLYYTPQMYDEFKPDHSALDRVVRVLSMEDNQLKCAVKIVNDSTGEIRESVLTLEKDGTITEKLGKSKNSIKVVYNGKELELGKPGAVMIEGSVYIPLRAFSQELGYKVGWDVATKTASIKNDTDEIYIDMKGNAKINGVESVTDKTPKIIDNSTYVPLRFISEAFGIKVDWYSATKTVDMVK